MNCGWHVWTLCCGPSWIVRLTCGNYEVWSIMNCVVDMWELRGVVYQELWLRCGNYVLWSTMGCGLDEGAVWRGPSWIVVEMWELCVVVHHELWLRCGNYVVWSTTHHELWLRCGNYVVRSIMNCGWDVGTMWCGPSWIVVGMCDLCGVVHHELCGWHVGTTWCCLHELWLRCGNYVMWSIMNCGWDVGTVWSIMNCGWDVGTMCCGPPWIVVEMLELYSVVHHELWLRCWNYVVWFIMNLWLRCLNYVVWFIMNCCWDVGTMCCGSSWIVVEMWELCGVVHHELCLRCWNYVVWSIMNCGWHVGTMWCGSSLIVVRDVGTMWCGPSWIVVEMWELCGVVHHELWLKCGNYVVWSIMNCGWDVGTMCCVTLLCIGTFYSCNGMYVPNFSSYEILKWTAH